MSQSVNTVPTPYSPVRKAGDYWRLSAGSFRTMLDIGMLATGVGLVGLALVVIASGLGVGSVDLGLSTGAALGSGLVIGVVGAFALGVASEGGYGAAESIRRYPPLLVGLGRGVSALVVSLVLLILADRVEPLISDLPLPLDLAREVIRSAGAAGLMVALIAVPAVTGAQWWKGPLRWIDVLELPLFYALWTLFTLVFYQLPPL